MKCRADRPENPVAPPAVDADEPTCPLGCHERPRHRGRVNRSDVWLCPVCGCSFSVWKPKRRPAGQPPSHASHAIAKGAK